MTGTHRSDGDFMTGFAFQSEVIGVTNREIGYGGGGLLPPLPGSGGWKRIGFSQGWPGISR